jgi:hypothetical protein
MYHLLDSQVGDALKAGEARVQAKAKSNYESVAAALKAAQEGMEQVRGPQAEVQLILGHH